MADERERCPKCGAKRIEIPGVYGMTAFACGTEMNEHGGIFEFYNCLSRQLAQAQEELDEYKHVAQELDTQLVSARRELDAALAREERLRRVVEAARKLAVAAEQVLKAWDMGDDVSDAIEELREAALDYAAVEAGEPEFEVEVIEIDDHLEAGRPERAFRKGEREC